MLYLPMALRESLARPLHWSILQQVQSDRDLRARVKPVLCLHITHLFAKIASLVNNLFAQTCT